MSTDSTNSHTGTTDDAASGDEQTTPAVDPRNLIAEEQTLAFRGIAETSESYPDEIEPTASDKRISSNPATFKELIGRLPVASSGDLYADNRFVNEYGGVDTAAIRDIDGLDVDALEDLTNMDIEQLAGVADTEPLIEVNDNQDIIDERRLALSTLGAPVKYRWQIASDGYCIVQPSDAFLPIISAMQKRGSGNIFGWAHYRDWGGEFKMTILFPELGRTIVPKETEDEDSEEVEGDATFTESTDDNEGVTVYSGIQTGYDFRGSQAVWATPMLYVPASDVAIYGVGSRRSRRHTGSATDAAHERKNNRTPINEWWGNIYDEIENRTATVDDEIVRGRSVSIDFDDVPYSITDFYEYLGVSGKYAEEATKRVKRFASPPTEPTLWNLQLSLQVALDDLYNGSRASRRYKELNEIGQQIYREPEYSLQMALSEHDRQAKGTDAKKQLPEDQQSLSGSIDDLVDVPGLQANSEADLSNVEAQRIQENVSETLQQALSNI